MATCGYICPVCEGSGFNKETLESCNWCSPPVISTEKIISDEEWMETVHTKNCCSDVGTVDLQEFSN